AILCDTATVRGGPCPATCPSRRSIARPSVASRPAAGNEIEQHALVARPAYRQHIPLRPADPPQSHFNPKVKSAAIPALTREPRELAHHELRAWPYLPRPRAAGGRPAP